ncbi:MAG: outer membrane lipoprotein-sorting protein [Gammaproteobacteria bacterium]|nr:outer membrane lipoprotein-sorting protein [Gammaproteobacteria bacterium]MDH5630010.1 outer membrane lipoprotein-sorting protein [Gammaproteobacteria bacterium]
MKYLKLTTLLFLLVGTNLQVNAENTEAANSAEDKGLQISKTSKEKNLGWQDTESEMEMILKNRHGETSNRQMRIKSLEQENDGDKSLTIFDSPRDVAGTAFLSFSHPTADDEQWLYLPQLKRVKRISSSNKSGSFMGSEFSFEDLTSFEVEKFTYKYIKDETVDGLDAFVVEQYPVDKYSGYTKRVVWIDKAEYRSLKIDFYDRKNTLLKTLTFKDYKQYIEKYWRAHTLEMINHQNGKSTVINWKNYKFQQGLDDSDFNKNALKRAR